MQLMMGVPCDLLFWVIVQVVLINQGKATLGVADASGSLATATIRMSTSLSL